MNRGVGLSMLLVLGGIWLGVAPFLIGYAPTTGSVWTGPVELSVWLGLVIVVAGLIGLVGFWSSSMSELQRAASASESSREPIAVNSSVPAIRDEDHGPSAERAPEPEATDPEAALQAMVDRVLRDHSLAFEKKP